MDELLEVYTEAGKSTGKLKPRSEVHSTGLWHKTVQVWIMNNKNEVIIQRRQPKKEGSPRKWDVSCGGHCTVGDFSIKSAIRETEEEMGLKFSESDFVHIGSGKYTSMQGMNNEFIDVYLVNYNYDISNIKFQEEEIDAIKSVKISELGDKEKLNFANRGLAIKLLFEHLENKSESKM